MVTSEKENDKIKVARKPIGNHEALNNWLPLPGGGGGGTRFRDARREF